ncbi:MAG: hypothetical protein ACI8PB_004970 [Desulforhopalus sp.]|jgi:hypothetical protein
MAKRKKKNTSLTLGHYVVGFMDLLGQQENLRSLSVLPLSRDQEELDKIKEELKKTYGAVVGMRKFFNESFEGFKRKPIDTAGFSAEQKKEYVSLDNHPIKMQSFSDSMVIFMPLKMDMLKLPVRGIYGIFGSAATTFLCCLAIGHPIRGGIDVGLGMDITKNEIYGPALSRSYSLESRIANYPRIVVGNELIKHLETLSNQVSSDNVSEVSKTIARQCLDCLVVDSDGYHVIDYLGQSYLDLFGAAIDTSVITKSYQQVLTFCEKFQSEKNTKLAFRYTLLRNYFEDRLHLWENLISKQDENTNKKINQTPNIDSGNITVAS